VRHRFFSPLPPPPPPVSPKFPFFLGLLYPPFPRSGPLCGCPLLLLRLNRSSTVPLCTCALIPPMTCTSFFFFARRKQTAAFPRRHLLLIESKALPTPLALFKWGRRFLWLCPLTVFVSFRFLLDPWTLKSCTTFLLICMTRVADRFLGLTNVYVFVFGRPLAGMRILS